MFDDDVMIRCPECDELFQVVWQRSATTGDGPKHCPFCGDEIGPYRYHINGGPVDDDE